MGGLVKDVWYFCIFPKLSDAHVAKCAIISIEMYKLVYEYFTHHTKSLYVWHPVIASKLTRWPCLLWIEHIHICNLVMDEESIEIPCTNAQSINFYVVSTVFKVVTLQIPDTSALSGYIGKENRVKELCIETGNKALCLYRPGETWHKEENEEPTTTTTTREYDDDPEDPDSEDSSDGIDEFLVRLAEEQEEDQRHTKRIRAQ